VANVRIVKMYENVFDVSMETDSSLESVQLFQFTDQVRSRPD